MPMLSPHELKNAEFSKSLRGYSTVEVDEHIAFLIEKYTELYRLNDELEKKLRLTEAQLSALKAEEESIRLTLVNAQKASTRIIAEANERADVIMRSAKTGCDRLIAELKVSVNKENERLRSIQHEVSTFKTQLFEEYRTHIAQIEAIAPEVRIAENPGADPDKLSAEVLSRIRHDLTGKSEIISGSEDPFTPIIDDGIEEIAGNAAEAPIPDRMDTDVAPDPDAFAAARDGEIFEEEENDGLNEKTIVLEPGASIVDSIRRLNENVDKTGDDDAEFLRMLKNASADADSSHTDEFDVVYDNKKK